MVIGASRIYNGVHTYNQVISGFTWGFFTYYAFCQVYYTPISNFVIRLRDKNTQASWLIWNPMIQMFIAAHFLAVLLYIKNLKFNPIPSEWIQAIARNCVSLDFTDVDVELHNYIQFNYSWAFMGAYLGLILDTRFLETGGYP